jgi:hypothetical protein
MSKYNDTGCLKIVIWAVLFVIVLPIVGYSNDWGASEFMIAIVALFALAFILFWGE